MKPPQGWTISRTSWRTESYGAMGAQMATPPPRVISDATKPIRRMLRSRCSLEKPSSDERFLRTRSPSRRVTPRPPSSRSLTRSPLAMVDLPDPESPVQKTVNPWESRPGRRRRSSRTTPGKLNHSGISRPSARRLRTSSPVMLRTRSSAVDLDRRDIPLPILGVDHLLGRNHLDPEILRVGRQRPRAPRHRRSPGRRSLRAPIPRRSARPENGCSHGSCGRWRGAWLLAARRRAPPWAAG